MDSMIASTFSEVAAGIAGMLTAAALLVTALGSWRKLGRIEAVTRSTDHAVNGKAPGAQSIQGQVSDLHDERFPRKDPLTNGAAILPTMQRIEALTQLAERL